MKTTEIMKYILLKFDAKTVALLNITSTNRLNFINIRNRKTCTYHISYIVALSVLSRCLPCRAPSYNKEASAQRGAGEKSLRAKIACGRK